ncbi:aldose epimerase family protein [Maribacter halichondriae]|uniref:aldose epimerase family protein n=1 Tax=Maribacter halichondriae TaxID=2980554 RepID=UPI0023586305|nr:aldose epimerase family protein [Maribacter sp. Hal144]
MKDKEGNSRNVVVGYDYPSLYPTDKAFLGACVGRYAGRISKGKFELDRQTYPLFTEHGMHLHGGKEGFGKKYWTIEEVHRGKNPFVKLSYFSKHLEEGYPGNLNVFVTYRLVENTLQITHEAATDRTTVINLTNHSYFKLDDSESVNHYELQLNCSQMVETQENLLPTGNIITVKNTEYDFLNRKKIAGQPLDTPYIINPDAATAAKVSSKKSGISMEVSTNQPAVVVYTPPHFPGICFETQNYPDAPNQKNFPSSVLRPGERYLNDSKFTFDIEI